MRDTAPSLETERLRLRALRDDDFETYASFCADEEVVPHLYGRALSAEEARQDLLDHMASWSPHGYGMWALEERKSGRLIGRAGLHHPHGVADIELGWMLGRAHWGQGYATEAGLRALAYAFDATDRNRVVSIMRPQNQRSIAVAVRLGMQPEGTIEFEGAPARLYSIRRVGA
ncbi:MAG: GNAT family N-acetyltransferase [bacterium]|nr:GNAT family N-acetyltransferase [bacterium]